MKSLVKVTKEKTIIEIHFEAEVSNQVTDVQFLFKGESTHKQEFLDLITSEPVFLGKCYLDPDAIQKPKVSLSYNEIAIALESLTKDWKIESSSLPKIDPNFDKETAEYLKKMSEMGIAVY
jgi:hypothetical protein